MWENPDLSLALWGIVWALVLVVLAIGSLVRWQRSRPKKAVAETAAATAEAARPSARERFRSGLRKTSEQLGQRIRGGFGRQLGFEALLAEIEQGLIESDIGVRSAGRLLDVLRALPGTERTEDGIRAALRRELRSEVADDWREPDELSARPWVVLVVGVNGVGKTTTIGKLATRHREKGRSVLLVAGDTFRAAAVDQLTIWAERSRADIVKQGPGTDPAAVVFDGLNAAVSRGVDVVLIDTAGRLHTKVNLMEELKKLTRVAARACPGAPHEVLLVLDATTGQNAVSQARTFAGAVSASGVILTKLDGSARGGVVVSIRQELGLPVRYVGLGEGAADLQPFDPEAFVDGLVPSAGSPRTD